MSKIELSIMPRTLPSLIYFCLAWVSLSGFLYLLELTTPTVPRLWPLPLIFMFGSLTLFFVHRSVGTTKHKPNLTLLCGDFVVLSLNLMGDNTEKNTDAKECISHVETTDRIQ